MQRPGRQSRIPYSKTLDAIEAASKALFDARGLDRIRCCCETLGQQAQFVRAKPVTFAFQNGEFGGLKGDLFPGWLACYDAAASDRLPHEPASALLITSSRLEPVNSAIWSTSASSVGVRTGWILAIFVSS